MLLLINLVRISVKQQISRHHYFYKKESVSVSMQHIVVELVQNLIYPSSHHNFLVLLNSYFQMLILLFFLLLLCEYTEYDFLHGQLILQSYI